MHGKSELCPINYSPYLMRNIMLQPEGCERVMFAVQDIVPCAGKMRNAYKSLFGKCKEIT
jgi:hypothetical protein